VRSVTEIIDYVIHELRWDPQITHPDAIGVGVTAGTVVLGGYVWTCAQKLAAARAARRVPGVRAVINNTQVRPASLAPGDQD
jgi:osmotically-inducible protein OsmY